MLTVEYCQEKLREIDKTKKRYQEIKTFISSEYIRHLSRLQKAYTVEYTKALKEGRYSETNQPIVDRNLKGWRS